MSKKRGDIFVGWARSNAAIYCVRSTNGIYRKRRNAKWHHVPLHHAVSILYVSTGSKLQFTRAADVLDHGEWALLDEKVNAYLWRSCTNTKGVRGGACARWELCRGFLRASCFMGVCGNSP